MKTRKGSFTWNIALLLLIAGCEAETSRKSDLLEVKKTQPGYVQVPKLVEYVEMATQEQVIMACGDQNLWCCMKESPEMRFIVYAKEKEIVCKAHELDHAVFGPLHEGEEPNG